MRVDEFCIDEEIHVKLEAILSLFLTTLIAAIGVLCLSFIVPWTMQEGYNIGLIFLVETCGVLAIALWLWLIRKD